jgi:hypothetical protein
LRKIFRNKPFAYSFVFNPIQLYVLCAIPSIQDTCTLLHSNASHNACPIPSSLVGDGDTHHPTSLQSNHTDTKYGANFDPNYPERAYIPNAAAGNTFSYKYKLPAGLTGNLVLLQWHYVMANSCIPEGYYEYNWPVGTYWSGPNPLNMATCGPLPLDGEWIGKNGDPRSRTGKYSVHCFTSSTND